MSRAATGHKNFSAKLISAALFGIALAALVPTAALSQEPSLKLARLDAPVSLATTWKFHPGDDPSWASPDLDDRAWETIQVPRPWGRQGHLDAQIAWYRLTLEFGPEALEEPLGLTLGKVVSAYELYVGGSLLGSIGSVAPEPRMEYDRYRTWHIPQKAIGPDGRLVLALRVWRADSAGRASGGPTTGPFEIGRLDETARRALRVHLPQLVLTALFLALGIYHVRLDRDRKQGGIYLWFGLFALDHGVFTFFSSQWRFALSDNFVLLKELEYLSRYLLPVFGIQFIWALFNRPIGRLLRLYQLSHAFLAVLVVITPGLELNLITIRFWNVWAIPALVGTVLLVFWEIRAGHPDGRTLGIGLVFLALAYFHDIAAGQGFWQAPSLSPWAFAFLMLSMAMSLSRGFTRLHRALEEARADLEDRVRERTRDLEEASDRAQAASQAKSAFLANMSHEIRTPMNGILGLGEMLLKSDLTSYQRDLASHVQASAGALLRVIDDILDVSRIEAGKLHLEHMDFDLRAELEALVTLLKPQATSKGLQLDLHFDPEVSQYICSDPVRLRQILLNLVGNAVKFTAQGGVEIRVELRAADRLLFAVRDTGIGIGSEDLEKLFEPFEQADTSTSRRFGGTGLGLTISRQLAELLGGTLSAESVLGEGSTFRLDLPIDVVTAAPDASAPRADVACPRQGGRLLLVDDDSINRMVAQMQLEDLGYEIDVASDGQEAVDTVEAARDAYDLVLMDCRMPGLDGYAATRALRARGHRMPVIAVTAHALAGEREKCYEAGMDDYLVKPFRQEELAEMVERWLLQCPP